MNVTPIRGDDSRRNNDHRRMENAVRRRERLSERWQQEGERPLWRNLSMIGALGWLIIVPTLIGIVAGRWLDNRFDTGITFTAGLIFAGIALGCALAWQRVNKEE